MEENLVMIYFSISDLYIKLFRLCVVKAEANQLFVDCQAHIYHRQICFSVALRNIEKRALFPRLFKN